MQHLQKYVKMQHPDEERSNQSSHSPSGRNRADRLISKAWKTGPGPQQMNPSRIRMPSLIVFDGYIILFRRFSVRKEIFIPLTMRPLIIQVPVGQDKAVLEKAINHEAKNYPCTRDLSRNQNAMW